MCRCRGRADRDRRGDGDGQRRRAERRARTSLVPSKIAERKPQRDRCVTGEERDALYCEWRQQQEADDRRDGPTDDEAGAVLVSERQQHDPDGEHDHAGGGEPVRGLSLGRAPGERRNDRDTRGGARRPPGCDQRSDDRENEPEDDCEPRKVEWADAVVDHRLHRSEDGQPNEEANRSAAGSGRDADHGPIGDHDETNGAIVCADRREHAERSHPSLRHDREARDREQPDEEHPDRGQREDRALDRGFVSRATAFDVHTRAARQPVIADVATGCVEQHRGVRRRRQRTGRDECELIRQVPRVLHRADDGVAVAVDCPRTADAQTEGGCNRLGDGDLTGMRRITTGIEPDGRCDIRTVRVFRADVECGNGSRYGYAPMGDHVDRSEVLLQRGDVSGEMRV